MLTMATPIFPQVKDKITIFTAHDEDMIFYNIDTDEIPGFLLLLKNHIFTARSEDTIFIVYV